MAAALLVGGCDQAGAIDAPVQVPAPAPAPSPSPAPVPSPSPTPSPIATPRAPGCTAANAVTNASSLVLTPRAGSIGIVAIGSSSTAGFLASSPAASYPSVLQSLLAARTDLATFVVHNQGRNGDTLAGTQARLQEDALRLQPQLVILQAGTNDANAGQNDAALADYAQRLELVVAQLKRTGAVVLMTSQHFPNEPAILRRYQDAMAEVAVRQNVPLFDRHKLMKHWIDAGIYGYSDILAGDRFHPNDLTYRCMADVMADLIVSRTTKPAG